MVHKIAQMKDIENIVQSFDQNPEILKMIQELVAWWEKEKEKKDYELNPEYDKYFSNQIDPVSNLNSFELYNQRYSDNLDETNCEENENFILDERTRLFLHSNAHEREKKKPLIGKL